MECVALLVERQPVEFDHEPVERRPCVDAERSISGDRLVATHAGRAVQPAHG